MNDLTNLHPRGSRDGLGPNSNIGAKLRAYYGAVEDQPIPDKFLELLEKLDSVERSGKAKNKDA
ncbi:MAG: NepR family anti-sigma factor [Devosia sp.]